MMSYSGVNIGLHPRGTLCPSFVSFSSLMKSRAGRSSSEGARDPQGRARGKPGADRTHGSRAMMKAREVGPQVNRSAPAFPARWFTAYFALSQVTGLSCHLPRETRDTRLRELNASVGASGPHDFAVRVSIIRLLKPPRPSHPAPNVRDDREAPLCGTGCA